MIAARILRGNVNMLITVCSHGRSSIDALQYTYSTVCTTVYHYHHHNHRLLRLRHDNNVNREYDEKTKTKYEKALRATQTLHAGCRKA